MTRARLARLELVGFRAFGQSSQGFDLSETVSVLWGGNSQGKTSLAEAVEFLFSGQIVRRDLLASAKDEFAEALRNAHIADNCPARVDAHIVCPDDKVRKLSRILVEDYKRGNAAGCVSRLEIDGAPAQEGDIATLLGVPLSHSPLIAPVLTQHTLAYIFSAAPNERAAYFRALLDTQDLEDFRAMVATLAASIPPATHPYLTKLADAEKALPAKPALLLVRKASKLEVAQAHLAQALKALLASIGASVTEELEADANQLDAELSSRRAKTFPLDAFKRGAVASIAPLSAEDVAAIETFLAERDLADAEATRLVGLFSAALDVHAHAEQPDDCPLCGTTDALTPSRIAFIRDQVAAGAKYKAAANAFDGVLRALAAKARAAEDSVRLALPEFLRKSASERKRIGFSIGSVRTLVGDDDLVDAWLTQLRGLLKTVCALRAKYRRLARDCDAALEDAATWSGRDDLLSLLGGIAGGQQAVEAISPVYVSAVQAVFTPLKEAVDQSTATDGWEALVDCARSPESVMAAVAAAQGHAALLKALDVAHSEIEKGNGQVADDKFSELSDDVRLWWERLRPDEPTFFDGVRRRSARAKRTVDLRVGMALKDDRSDAKFRDAVAVLSQSQLHCLGLSLFLARAVKEKAGFVMLDDPVLTSDDDYRPNFASSVMEGLMDAGIQVVVTTQDNGTWKDIGHRWEHRGATLLQLVRNDPREGTEVRNQSDDLATMIARAQPFTRSQDPEQRKEGAIKLRLAIERFCKVLLVKDRKAKGDNTASITDYDGRNFGDYRGQVEILLVKDPAHPGKIIAAHNYVTPGPHDDAPPSSGQLKMAFGDLKRLKKDYLDS